jgi:light-harvesting protein B-800-850 alpha chain
MNEGRLWLYVKPTVGIPLFFLGFMLASLLVHASILTNTTWFPAFFQGGADAAPAAAEAPAAAPAAMEAAPAAAPAEAPAAQ